MNILADGDAVLMALIDRPPNQFASVGTFVIVAHAGDAPGRSGRMQPSM